MAVWVSSLLENHSALAKTDGQFFRSARHEWVSTALSEVHTNAFHSGMEKESSRVMTPIKGRSPD